MGMELLMKLGGHRIKGKNKQKKKEKTNLWNGGWLWL